MSYLIKGYWISPKGDSIEVVEHFQYVRENPKTFGFTLSEAKTWTRDDREEVIRRAISRGWIRVRGHKRFITFEVHELTQNAIFDISEHLKREDVHPDERIRVNELFVGRSFDETADHFYSGEVLAAARNPQKDRINAGVLPNGGSLYPDGSRFVPSGGKSLVGARPNPSRWESWGKTTKATILVGLRAGRSGRGFRKGEEIPERLVYRLVFGVRTEQVGRQYGASFVRQRGHYIPEKARKIGTERARREPSVQVVIYPGQTETWRAFKRHIRELANEILEWLAQESVIIEYMKDGRVEEVGKLEWRKGK